jgi:DNA repair exonuclease SbcCD ATPase subunit
MREISLEKVAESIEKLEDSLIADVTELKTSTEMILKELTGYLNISSQNLTDVQTTTTKIDTTLASFKDYLLKLDFIEKKFIELPQKFYELEQQIKRVSEAQSRSDKNAESIANYLRKMAVYLGQQNTKFAEISNNVENLTVAYEATKEEIMKSQSNLVSLIKTMVTSKENTESAKIDLQKNQIKQAGEITRTRFRFWAKIIGIFMGSGGVAVLVVKFLLEMIHK